MFSANEVKKLADLALLDVSDAEVQKLAGEMGAILAYVSELSTLGGTAGGEPQAGTLRNVLREDGEPTVPGTYTEVLLREVPVTEGRYVKVKKIL